MHTNLEYGKISLDEVLMESPSADGFLDPKGHWQNKSKRQLYVYENEGNYPHCHIVGLGSDGRKEVCVRLDVPEYFSHGTKKEKFTGKEKELFIKFINSKDSFGTIRWNWVAATWNGFAQDNENMQSIKIRTVPNYNKLDTE